ncbi:MAG: NUDIX domain-containing protein [Patescibacteria group bacterium]
MVKYSFCPYCRGKLSYRKDHYQCTSCQKKVFISSYPGVSILPIKDGKVLLAKRAEEPKKGTWDSIGGFLKEGEDPEIGVERETKEETGLEVKLKGLLGIYTDTYEYEGQVYETLGLDYLAEITGGAVKPKDDVSELVWFPIEKVPKNIAFKSVAQALKDLKRLYKGSKKGISLYSKRNANLSVSLPLGKRSLR